MTQTEETEDETATETVTESQDRAEDEGETRTDGRDTRYYVERAILAILLVIGFVASLRFYLSASSAIDYWVTDAYVNVFQAAFNLLVLLLVAVGVSIQVRKVT